MNIHEDLLRRAKKVAAETDRTLGDVVTDALRLLFEQERRQEEPPPLPVGRFSAPTPGVDLSPRGLKEIIAAEEEARWHARS